MYHAAARNCADRPIVASVRLTSPSRIQVSVVKFLRFVVVILLLAGTGLALVWYWHYRTVHPSTDDAYVHAHILQVSTRITAPVKQLHVTDNQYVRRGEPLFDLGTATFQTAVDAARAQLDIAAQDTGADGALVRAASAVLRERQVAADNAHRSLARIQLLAQRKLVSAAELDNASAADAAAQAAVDSARAELDRAREGLGRGDNRNAALRAAAAALARAELELSFAHITAPVAGWVTNLSLREGAMVRAARPQFALVEEGSWWLEANFRETDLARIRPGHPARIVLDMYPDLALDGWVESISAGSGATFSLLPPENATGNWVKVTQRFPVRIQIAKSSLAAYPPLRIGASATVTVDTELPP